jgi:Ser/Thr protein kinase RdoA (MazF antagonist)
MAEIAQRLRDGSVPLVTGRSHAHARIAVAGRRVFLKVCTDARRLPRMESEYAWLQQLLLAAPDLVPHPIGLAPVPGTSYHAVLATAEESGRSLQALLEAPEADGPILVRRFGQALARLHALPVRGDRITLDGQQWDTWRAFIVESATLCMDDIVAKGGELAASVRARIEAKVAGCDLDVPAAALVVVHGDPTPDNLLLGAAGAVFTDFEVTQIGDRWLDIAVAGLLWLDKRPDAWPHFQEGYGRAPDQCELARIHVYRVLRALRLMRGKVWIYRDRDGFARDRDRLMELLNESA